MSLRISIQLTEKDVVRAHAFTLLQLGGTRAFLLVTTLLASALLLWTIHAITNDRPALTLIAGIAGIGAVALSSAWVAYKIRERARLVFASMSAEERRGDYTFGDRGFEWTVGRAPGRLDWSAVTRVVESTDYVFLLTPGARTHVIPKRSMRDEEVEEIRRLSKRDRGVSSL